jgi:acylaminoacyl-peptidase
MLRSIPVLLPFALAASPGGAAAQADPPRPVTAEDLPTLKRASGLVLSPDGERLAFLQEGAVWVLETYPGATPRRVAQGSGPTWSPSGDRLAFFAPAGASGLQIFTVDVDEGEAVQVTTLEGGVIPDRVAWSSQDVLAFVVDVPLDATELAADPATPEPASAEAGFPLVLGPDSPDGYAFDGILVGTAGPVRTPTSVTEVFVHHLARGETRQLTHDGVGYLGVAWSPDGRWIAVASREGFRRGQMRSGIYLVHGTTGERHQAAPPVPMALDPQWSPDGRRLAYAVYSRTDLQASGVAVVDVDDDGRTGDPVLAVSPAIVDYAWAADGNSLFVTQDDGVARPVRRVELASGGVRTVGSANHLSGSLTVSRMGDVAWSESRGDVPVVFRFLEHGHDEGVDLYDPNPHIDVALGRQEIVRWRNTHGHERAGVLILPVGYEEERQYPLIVSAYSQGTHFNTFNDNGSPGFGSQIYAGLGYAVFFPGPRVPWMYGGAVSADPVGGADSWAVTFDDVESGVDVLIERGIVDPGRMAIMGFSNGGAVAAALMTHTQRYRAAVAVAPANLNWLVSALHQDNMAERWIPTQKFMGATEDVIEDPLEYLRGSPVFRLGEIQTPMLLAVGDRDDASFILPTIQIYLGLRRLGRDVTLLRYAGVPHGFYGPAATDLNGRILEFLERHLR